MRAFAAALNFLTIFHLPVETTSRDRAFSLYFFGLIGLILGGLLVCVDWITRHWWPSAVTNVIMLAVLLVATGGLHFDGLLDTCDGVFAHRGPEERLAIMRDSRSGSFAVAAGVIDLLLWWACSVDLTGAQHFGALLVMGVTSRAGMVLAIALFPYGRRSGLGIDYKQSASLWPVIVNTVLAAGLGYALLGRAGLIAAVAGLASATLSGIFLMSRLPGLTGDCYGAINEVAQVATLFALVPFFT